MRQKINVDSNSANMQKTIQEIKKVLVENATEHNKAFSVIMVPGKQHIYGVKTPILNQLAKEYKAGSFELVEALWQEASMEEQIIAIKITEKIGKTNPDLTLRLFKKFSGTINNWAVCDGLGMQFLRGIVKSHSAAIFEIAATLNGSKNLWQRRLSLVMVEWYTRDKKLHKAIKQLVDRLENDTEYYVKKAVQWIKRNLAKGK